MNLKLLAAVTALVPVVAFAQSTTVSTTNVTKSGSNITSGLQNAAANTYFENDGKTLLVVKNNGNTNITATVKTAQLTLSKEGYSTAILTDEAVTVPSNSTVLIGPLPTTQWNQPSGTVRVTMSDATNVSATAKRLR